MNLTAEQIVTVKSTAPVVKQYGTTITATFYRNLLAAHPELKNYFSLRNQHNRTQQIALANAVFAYAAYIDDLPRLKDAVERIAHKHASLFIQKDHYPIVGKYLVGAFAEVLGDALTPVIADAWIAAYHHLADVFINREQQLYDEAGDWQSWRSFRIAQKQAETDSIVTLYLEPVDGKPLPRFKPGQYVSLQLPIPELNGLLQNRQFSLSIAPEDEMQHYRVSVKKHTADQDATVPADKAVGIVANKLHLDYAVGDEVSLSPPRGDFFFDATTAASDGPVVLLSIGVGATPLVSILDFILKSAKSTRPVTWVQAARCSDGVCFRQHIRDLTNQHANVKRAVFVKSAGETDEKGIDYDFDGRLSLDRLANEGLLHLDNHVTEYYMCGPEDWMVQTRDHLLSRKVPLDRIHLELFRAGEL